MLVRLFVCVSVCQCACFQYLIYSTSHPSGNQVDGLPLVLHTRALVVGVDLPPALSGNNCKKLCYENIYYDAFELKLSEQIQDNTE